MRLQPPRLPSFPHVQSKVSCNDGYELAASRRIGLCARAHALVPFHHSAGVFPANPNQLPLLAHFREFLHDWDVHPADSVARKISAFTVNLTYNLEPIYSIILAMILFGEAKDLGLSFYIGLAFIALSVGLQTWSVMRIQKRVAALDKLAAEDSDKKPHPVFIEPIGSRKERE